jgi:tetratricopeptide (TPR) repeat protein
MIDRLALTATSVRDSLRMLVWPHPLLSTYRDYTATSLPAAVAVHAAAIAVAAVAVWKRRAPGLVASLAFVYLSILPSTRLFTDPEISMAISERYVYLPSAGLAIALAYGADALRRARGSLVPVAAAGAVSLLFLIMCFHRNALWREDELLFAADHRAAPADADPLRLLVHAKIDAGKSDEAVALCDERVAAHGDSPQLLINCAVAYANQQRFGDAERLYKEAGKSTVRSVPHANLAALYVKFGHHESAEQEYLEAIEEEIVPAQKHYRRAQMLLSLYGKDPARLREAIGELETALELRPRLGRARADLEFARRRLAEPGSNRSCDQSSSCDQ